MASPAGKDRRVLRLGDEQIAAGPGLDTLSVTDHRRVESWLAALVQMEHVNLLIGNGLSTAVGHRIGTPPPTMTSNLDAAEHSEAIRVHAAAAAQLTGRGRHNLEDEIRSALALIGGFEVLGDRAGADAVRDAVDAAMKQLISGLLAFEKGVLSKQQAADKDMLAQAVLLQKFLLPFASRAAGRDRLHMFTTNYDRLLEYTADLLGLRLIDRFVGTLQPTFSASRLDIDMHYSPPGVRGEPRLMEGVVRYSKVHGSLDWREDAGRVVKSSLPFGAEPSHPALPKKPSDATVIYPNPAKDVETLAYPYAELFRDLAAAICRPNAVLFTYGYGFGDSHINRVIADMLTIPSTHLVVASYGALDPLDTFKQGHYPESQTTELVGPEVASLEAFVGLLPSVASAGLLEAQTAYAERAVRLRNAHQPPPAPGAPLTP